MCPWSVRQRPELRHIVCFWTIAPEIINYSCCFFQITIIVVWSTIKIMINGCGFALNHLLLSLVLVINLNMIMKTKFNILCKNCTGHDSCSPCFKFITSADILCHFSYAVDLLV